MYSTFWQKINKFNDTVDRVKLNTKIDRRQIKSLEKSEY